MSERASKQQLPAQRPQQLPLSEPAPSGALALIAPMRELAELGREIEELRQARRRGQLDVQRQQAALARFQAADRPASRQEIAEEVGMLVNSFPNLTRTQNEVFTATLALDIEVAQPTLFELNKACRLVRRKHSFLGVKEVLDALSFARRKGSPRARYLLDAPNKPKGGRDYWTWLDAACWCEPEKQPLALPNMEHGDD
jgi:hypothetical protein